MDSGRFIRQGEGLKLWMNSSSHSSLVHFFIHCLYSPFPNLCSFPETVANRQLVLQIEQILAACNRRHSEPSCSSASNGTTLQSSHSRIAACKILRHCVKDEKMIDWDCVVGIEEEALAPHVIGWLAQHGSVGLMYNVVRDMPWLLTKKGERKR